MVRSKKKMNVSDDVFEDLSGANRRRRQEASHVVATLADESPELLLEHVNSLIDALYRPEAQTRWEILNALSVLAEIDAKAVAGAFDGAEASLFDDISGKVRLAAFQFLAIHGSTGESRSNKVWPLLDEAIQCYHGDIEYHSMLVALTNFASGTISKKTGGALVKRMSFDAKNGFGYVQSMSAKIIDMVQSKRTANSSAKKSSSRSSQSSRKDSAAKDRKTAERSEKESAKEAKASSSKQAVSREASSTAGPALDKKASQKDGVGAAKSPEKKAKDAKEVKTAKSTAKKSSSTKPAAKKGSAVTSTAKKATPKKSAKNTGSKRAATAKSTSKDSGAKKESGKDSAATKESDKDSAAKKESGKDSAATKELDKDSAAKKESGKDSAATKESDKDSAAKKSRRVVSVTE